MHEKYKTEFLAVSLSLKRQIEQLRGVSIDQHSVNLLLTTAVGRIMNRRSQHARMQNSDLISDSELNRNFLHDAFRKKFSCMRGGGSQCIPLH